jgi:GNAT superfamily N-acetyltransferase
MMSCWPSDTLTNAVLRDGASVRLRPLTPEDVGPLLDLAGHLPRGALYTRFFRTPRPPATEVQNLLAAEGDRLVVIVAECAGSLVGVACYARADDMAHAEVTLAVAVPFQRRGLGMLLLKTIARLAQADGVRTFDAFVLADNHSLRRLLRASGFSLTEQPVAGVEHVLLTLGPQFEPAPA